MFRARGVVELKQRANGTMTEVPVEQAVEAIQNAVQSQDIA